MIEAYLLHTRQLSPLGARQARLLSERLPAGSVRADMRNLLLLLLQWWERGAAGVNPVQLLQPLRADTLALQRENFPEDWKAEWNALADCANLEHVFNVMLAEPGPWAPLLGHCSAGAASLPLVVVDGERGLFSFARAYSAVRRLEAALRERLRPLEPLDVSADQHVRLVLKNLFARVQPRFHFRQVAACALALRTRTLVLAGGPGTGKTSVVVQILRTLLTVDPELKPDRMVLCAPTGRAKARMGESVQREIPGIPAQTLHGLLVQRPDGSFRYHRDNPLPYRVVVVDEASMVDLHLFAALLEALEPSARLVLLGDMHQLPSVDAGAVLGDLTAGFSLGEGLGSLGEATDAWMQSVLQDISHDNPNGKPLSLALEPVAARAVGPLQDHAIVLEHTYRSAVGIQRLCQSVNQGDGVRAWQMFQDPEVQVHAGWAEAEDAAQGAALLNGWWNQHVHCAPLQALRGIDIRLAAAAEPLRKAFAAMLRSRVLVVSHHGPLGRHALNRLAEQKFRAILDPQRPGPWFHGQQVLLGNNHHDLGLFNGDLGIMVQTSHGLQAVFQRGSEFVGCGPEVLLGLESAYAMTVHKSQGSEFATVLLVLPERDTPLLNRQILYTGITRAKEHVLLLGRPQLFRRGVERRDERPGGVRL